MAHHLVLIYCRKILNSNKKNARTYLNSLRLQCMDDMTVDLLRYLPYAKIIFRI